MIPSAVDILLAEDNPDDVELTLRSLEKVNILSRIAVANDGVEALQFLFGGGKYGSRQVNQKPRVVFLDLDLPIVDGLDVLRIMKSERQTETIPVVVLTSSMEELDIVRGRKLGVNGYIVKPITFDKFMEAIDKVGLHQLFLDQPQY